MNLVNKKTGFYNIDQYIDESFLDWTGTDPNEILQYPISFLNDALGGLTKSELVVVGADSGIGKSEFANTLAFDNSARGKNVFLFSLEGDRYDVINRQRYKEYIKMVRDTESFDRFVTYRDFIQNKVPEDMAGEIFNLDELFKQKYKTLNIYNREESLNMEKFEAHLDLINNEADLVIIDHLHYFDFKTTNEYSEINEIMKRIKKLQDSYRIPIVLISHLRKKDKTRIFPDQNDFHGSSNIVKQADTCIVLAHIEPNVEDDNKEHETQINRNVYKTGIRIVKARTGFSQRLVCIVDYDLNYREYSDRYNLAICGMNFITKMDTNNYPKWAVKHAKTEFDNRKTPY